MSDNYFDFLQNQQHIFQPDPNAGAELQARYQAQREHIRNEILQREQLRREQVEALKMPLSDAEFEFIFNGIKNKEIDEDEIYRLSAASIIARKYAIPISEVVANFDNYIRAEGINTDSTAKTNSQSLGKAVLNNALIGINTVRMGSLKKKFAEADYLNPDTEYAGALKKEIEFLENDSRSLQDTMPAERKFLAQKAYDVLTSAAQTVPYMAYMSFHQKLGGIVGLPLGISNFTGPAAGWAAGADIETGNEYWALRSLTDEDGNPLIDKDIAWNTANITGAVSSAIEQFLFGNIAKLGKAVAGKEAVGKAAKFIAGNVFKRLQNNGALYKAATYFTQYLLSFPEEMGEESAQSLSSAAGTAIAIELQNARLEGNIAHLPPEEQEAVRALRKIKQRPFKEILAEAAQAALDVIPAQFILGGIPLGVGAAGTVRQARQAREVAKTAQSEVEHRALSADLELYKGLDPEMKQAAQDKVYAATAGPRQREEARRAEELKETAALGPNTEEAQTTDGAEQPLDAPYRRPNGKLYHDPEDERVEHGRKYREVRFGDASKETKHNYYGGFLYHQEDGKLVIDRFEVAPRRENLTDEIFETFATEHAGEDIVWNPKTDRGQEIKDRLVKNNRRGEQYGLNYFAEAAGTETELYRRKLDAQAREHTGLGEGERRAWIDMVEVIGEHNGLGLRGTIEAAFADPDNIFTDTLEENRAAQAEGKTIKGATFWKETGQGLKAVMYVAKRGDFSTLAHETMHAYRMALKGIDAALTAQIDRALDQYVSRNPGMTDEQYNRAREEYLVERFEDYLFNGAAPQPELQSLFDQIAAFMRRIYNQLSGRRELAPEIEAAFDKIFAGEDARRQTAENATTAREGPRTAQTEPNTASPAGSAQEAARGQYEANKKLNRERPLLDKNNAKGDPKPKQPANDLDAVYRLVEESRGEFDSYVEELREKYGGEVKSRKELKGRDRAERKITPEAGAEFILDINGKTLVLDNIQSIIAVMEDLHGRDEVVRMKDRYKQPSKDHYRDTLVNIRMSNGAIVELQLNTKQMLAAKEEFGGHVLYEINEQSDNAGKQKTIDTSLSTTIADMALEGMIKLYDAAFEDALTGAISSASSFDITELLGKISDTLQESGALSKVLSAKTRQKMGDLYAKIRSSQSRNSSLGSSREGGANEGASTLGANAAELTESSFTTVPSNSSIGQAAENVKGNNENGVDLSGLPALRGRYEAADKTYGEADSVNIDGSEIEGRWVLTEAETPAASHDETTFNETAGFPRINGKSINDRDYKHDKTHQEAVLKIAGNYDSRALEGVVVTEDGVVISGNNRAMSGKLAARRGTDGKYRAALEKKAARYGFTSEQVGRFAHPRLLFEISVNGAYDTALFARFNLSTKKATGPLETSVKMSKLIKPETVETIAGIISEHETVDDLYKDKRALLDIFNAFTAARLTGEYDTPQYFSEKDGITDAGQGLLENVLLGAVLSEDNIRSLNESKKIRRKLVMALPQLVENRAMGEYSVIAEANEAARIAAEVDRNSKTWKNVEEWAAQQGLDFMEQRNQIAVELARQLEGKNQSGFADLMGGLNAVLADAASGQADLLASGVERKEDIVRRFLGVKAEDEKVRAANNKVIESKTAGMAEKTQAALDNAGRARAGADGTMFQLAWHGSPQRFERFDSSHMGEGEGAKAYGWGHYFASKKEIAEWYRESLSMPVYFEGDRQLFDDESTAASFLFDEDGARLDLETALKKARTRYSESGQKRVVPFIEKLADKNIRLEEGQLYEVDIPGDEEMLDWDRPLSEQPEQVREQLEEIKKTLPENAVAELGEDWEDAFDKETPGRDLYNIIEYAFGSDKKTSLYLNSLGIKGIRYLDGASRAAGEGSHNYVIFDDNEIAITQTFFQLDEQFLEEAAQYDTWEEFRDSQEEGAAVSKADNAWYQSFWQDAQKAYRTLFATEEQKPGKAQAADEYWLEHEMTREGLSKVLKAMIRAVTANLDALTGREREWAEYVQNRVHEELLYPGSFLGIAAQITYTKELTEEKYRKLMGYIRKHPRDFRDLFADIMERPEWARDLADEREGEPRAKIASARRKKEVNDPEKLRRIADAMAADEMSDPGLRREIEEGTVQGDDPRLESYRKGWEKGVEEVSVSLAELEKETAEDYGRLDRELHKRILEDYDALKDLESRIRKSDWKAAQLAREGRELGKTFLREKKALQSDYDAVRDKLAAYERSGEISAELREMMARRDERAAARERFTQIREKLKAYNEYKRIMAALSKHILRRMTDIFKNVAYDQAMQIITVQRLVAPYLSAGVNKLIGGINAPGLREVYYRWKTDEQFRQEVIGKIIRKKKDGSYKGSAVKRIETLKSILGYKESGIPPKGEWEDLSAEDRKALAKALPHEDWVERLKISALMGELKEAAQLDIREDGKGRVTLGETEERTAREALGEELFNRVTRKPFESWTMAEVAELAEKIDDLFTEGRIALRAMDEARRQIKEGYRNKLQDAIALTKFKINAGDSPEEKERKRAEAAKILGKYDFGDPGSAEGRSKRDKYSKKILGGAYFAANVRRVARILDSGRDGVFTNLLYWQEDQAYNRKLRNIRERTERLNAAMADPYGAAEKAGRLGTMSLKQKNIAEVETAITQIAEGADENGDKKTWLLTGWKEGAPDATGEVSTQSGATQNGPTFSRSDLGAGTAKIVNDLREEVNKNVKKTGGIRREEFFKKFTFDKFWSDGKSQSYTVEETLGMLVAERDRYSRKAIVYGNMLKPGEREAGQTDPESMMNRAEERYARVKAAAAQFFTGENEKFLRFAEAVAHDYEETYRRLNKAHVDIFNHPVLYVKHYFPMFRLSDTGDTNVNEIERDLLGLAGVHTQWTDDGMAQNRLTIAEINQTTIQLGLLTTWAKSLERVEHFIAYADYVRTLNGVFKGAGSAAMRQALQNRYGKGMADYISDYINEKANPSPRAHQSEFEHKVRQMRGKTATAYLAGKISGVLKQAVTSPWPYLMHIRPDHYWKAAVKMIAHPIKTWQAVSRASVFMANRDPNLMIALIKEEQDKAFNPAGSRIDRLNNWLMGGLTMIDRGCVLPGWMAVYERETARLAEERNLTEKEQELQKKGELTADVKEELAVSYADDIVRSTQPSGRDTDLAPMHKNNQELYKALLQFQSPKNVIYQQWRYDIVEQYKFRWNMPEAMRKQLYLQTVLCVAGYAAAGVMLMSLTEGIPWLEDDEEDKKPSAAWRRFLYYSLTQFTDSPMIGDFITPLAQGIITGKWGHHYGNNFFAVVDYGSRTVSSLNTAARELSEGDREAAKAAFIKAAGNLAQGFGISQGLPVSGGKELGRVFGIGDDDGEFDLYWQAILGRRKQQ